MHSFGKRITALEIMSDALSVQIEGLDTLQCLSLSKDITNEIKQKKAEMKAIAVLIEKHEDIKNNKEAGVIIFLLVCFFVIIQLCNDS